jgi:iron complex transport system substrate-binding protein
MHIKCLFQGAALWFAMMLPLSFSPLVAAHTYPGRVMSVNQCMEQMVASLSAELLVSVTWLSHLPHAPLYDLLQAVPVNHAEIEEVLSVAPDLVIGGEFGALGLKALVKNFGIQWQELPLHQNLEMFYQNWIVLGRWLRRERQASVVISNIRQDIDTVRAQLKPLHINTLMVNPNGWVAGSGNFQDAFLEAIGLINLATVKGISGWAQLSLEQLIRWQPELIIIAEVGYGGHSRATEWQRHPVFASYKSRYPLLVIDTLSCSGQSVGEQGRAIVQHVAHALSEQASLPAERSPDGS